MGLYAVTDQSEYDGLKSLIQEFFQQFNIIDSKNFLINGKTYNEIDWLTYDFNSIYYEVLPTMPFEGYCLAINSDGIDFTPKAIECFSTQRFVCEYWMLAPPTEPPTNPPTECKNI